MDIINLIAWIVGILGLVVFFKAKPRTYYLFIFLTTIPYMLPSLRAKVWINVFLSIAYGLIALYNYITRR
ncbi:hypothetical protein EB001_15510 [bacterium]|nr:hypothetical protein [bacterium]